MESDVTPASLTESRAPRTAILSAMMRAAHLLLDRESKIFSDPCALRLSGFRDEFDLPAGLEKFVATLAADAGTECAQQTFEYLRAVFLAVKRRAMLCHRHFEWGRGMVVPGLVVMVTFTVTLLATALAADAQQAGKVWRLGVLDPGSRTEDAARRLPLMQRLRDVGYVEHQNLVVEYRYAEGRIERLPDLAAELVRLKVDVIFTVTTPAVQAARKATETIPIVFVAVADPVGAGLVASLARPGANVTGVSSQLTDLTGKQLQLLKELVPRTRRIAVLWNPGNTASSQVLRETERIAPSLGMGVLPVAMLSTGDVEPGLSTIARDRPDAVIVHPTAPMWDLRTRIMEFTTAHRLPTITANREMARAGALMTYGPDFQDQRRQAVALIDRIFKGTKPAHLPVEQPTKFELAINVKTAKALGLMIPQSVLARADEIIE